MRIMSQNITERLMGSPVRQTCFLLQHPNGQGHIRLGPMGDAASRFTTRFGPSKKMVC